MEETQQNVRIEVRAKNNILKSAREKLQLTQHEMALLCEINVSEYGRAERLQEIALSSAIKISNVLDMPIQEIFPRWLTLFSQMFNTQAYLILDNDKANYLLENHGGNVKLLKESFSVDVKRALNTLKETDRNIVISYYGLFGHKAQSLTEIGKELDLTKEGVRQRLNKSLLRLRKKAAHLIDYIEDVSLMEKES